MTILDQQNWAARAKYSDLPYRCMNEAWEIVVMLRGPCVKESLAHSDEGFLLPSVRHYTQQSENFARIRDDFAFTLAPDENQTQHKILFIHGFYTQVLIAQKEIILESSDHWCGWRDKSETLYQAREVAELTEEFGLDMAVQWFKGVFV